jgi:hypothetical protein
VSTSDTIFLHTELSLDQVADRLRETLNLIRTVDELGQIFLVRNGPRDSPADVGGLIERNPYHPDPDPDEISVLDGYEIAWDVWTAAETEEISRAATRSLFNDVVQAFPAWPALLVLNLDTLRAASRPGVGVTEFPPHTTPDGKDRERWQPFDVLPDRSTRN